jgi:lysyl-tRNA synthetase, class II
MASFDEIRNARLEKMKMLREKGINPFPAQTTREYSLKEVIDSFEDLSKKESVILAGRVMAIRGQGALIFFNINDGTALFQGLLKKDEMEAEIFDLFVNTIDIGDFIEISGNLFITKKGQQTLQVKAWRILSKSLRPLPDKWDGLQDEEECLRKRYLDIMFNPEVKEMVLRRSTFWGAVRNFMLEKDFLEVETPVLENTTGGADARPFATHHNALDMEVYLRISMGELWQKRLMVAGFPKTFEIGRQFRNEGMDAEHLQDYTQMEFYWAYANYEDGMKFVEELYKYVAEKTFGTLKFKIGKFEVDLNQKWEQYDYQETVLKMTGIDVLKTDLKEIQNKLNDLKIDYSKDGFNLNRGIDNLWKYCRRQIAGPGFLVGVPVEISPLAKRDERNPEITQKFHPIIAGSELGNGYSELNDPLDQAGRFALQAKLREEGDEEAQMNDQDFVEAMEYGMPPVCGFGMSERVFSFLMNKPARECQIFPLLKPKK